MARGFLHGKICEGGHSVIKRRIGKWTKDAAAEVKTEQGARRACAAEAADSSARSDDFGYLSDDESKEVAIMAKKFKRRFLSGLAEGVIRAEEAKARMKKAALSEPYEVCRTLGTPQSGLTQAQAEQMRLRYGQNVLPAAGKRGILSRLAAAFVNPFTAILFVLALVSVLTDIVFAAPGEKNYMTVLVISCMVGVSGLLRFVQETRSSNAAAKLAAMVSAKCDVLRGERQEIGSAELAVGDIVCLSAGDMIPADLRILTAKDLFVSQSSLTGESVPEEKTAAALTSFSSVTSCRNLAFCGTNVVSGSGTGIVLAVGADTVLGGTAKTLAKKPEKTAFEKGVASVSHILIRFMLFMVPVVFLINGITKGDWPDAALFAVSIAVGLTPEMLPMIVTTCLAKGAVTLSRKKVVVKNVNAVQNFGSMDILCTDKTGTLTQDKVVLELHLNVEGKEDARVLRHAFLNSNYQTGLKNLMDAAVIERTRELCNSGEISDDVLENYVKTDEIPFDFERRRMSVAVRDKAGKVQLITKGAVEEMLAACAYAEVDGAVISLMEEVKARVRRLSEGLNERGMRVLAVAQKRLEEGEPLRTADESEMVLIGCLAFLDPPKSTTAPALERLKSLGVRVKILTGDNEKVTACICRKVGLDGGAVLLGGELEELNDEELAKAAEKASVFAKLSPSQKERVVRVLRENGHTVGYMGDGINDAPAMRAADVGISVDTAADIAKESADLILLEKDLTVVADGVTEGRKTYANMMKYIKITASSNFGNVFSVLAASAFLPFLPMRSVQLILLNLVYDLSCTAMPWDNVEKAELEKPSVWDSGSVTRFMVRFGPLSSLFDILTYVLLFFVICPAICGGQFAAITGGALKMQFIALFQTGWFIESMFTQTLVIYMLRSPHLPVGKNRASLPVLVFTLCGIAFLTAVPFTFGSAIGLCPLPAIYFAMLAGIVAAYMLLTTLVKKLYVRKYGKLI